jgi:hypothetical protein
MNRVHTPLVTLGEHLVSGQWSALDWRWRADVPAPSQTILFWSVNASPRVKVARFGASMTVAIDLAKIAIGALPRGG